MPRIRSRNIVNLKLELELHPPAMQTLRP